MNVPTPDRLLELLDAMAGQPVALWADLVLDRFLTGTPKRISREAPVLILRYDGETATPGGGANAVLNVAALGGRPLPLGVVGDDTSGDELLALFAANGIPTDAVLRRKGFRTPTKTRILAGARHSIKQQIVRYDVEDEIELTEDDRKALLAALAAHRSELGAVVLSDYGYGSVEPRLVGEIRALIGADCPILGDSRYRLSELQGLDGATPNAEEAEALYGGPLDDEGLKAAGPGLRQRLAARYLLVTRGSSGMSLYTAEGAAHLPVHGTDQVADVTGAGDTVIGTFALALAAGATALEATALANYAGGIVVMKMGTATLTPDELRSAIVHNPELLESVTWEES
jgi:rfaE bifunctional protein kinase chain/domain